MINISPPPIDTAPELSVYLTTLVRAIDKELALTVAPQCIKLPVRPTVGQLSMFTVTSPPDVSETGLHVWTGSAWQLLGKTA